MTTQTSAELAMHDAVVERIDRLSQSAPDSAEATARTYVDSFLEPVRTSGTDAQHLIDSADQHGRKTVQALSRIDRTLRIIDILPGPLGEAAARARAGKVAGQCEDLMREVAVQTAAFAAVAADSTSEALAGAESGVQYLADAASQPGRTGECWQILASGAPLLDDAKDLLRSQAKLLEDIGGAYMNAARQLEAAAAALHATAAAHRSADEQQATEQNLRDVSRKATVMRTRLALTRVRINLREALTRNKAGEQA